MCDLKQMLSCALSYIDNKAAVPSVNNTKAGNQGSIKVSVSKLTLSVHYVLILCDNSAYFS